MNELAQIGPTANGLAPLNELEYLTDNEIIDGLKKSFGLSAYAVAQAARYWGEALRRKIDLSSYRRDLHTFLPMVMAGRLLPELVAQFLGDGYKLRAFACLSVAEQRRLVEAGKVPIFDEKAPSSHIMVQLEQLTSDHIKLAFDADRGCVRSTEEQSRQLTLSPPVKRVSNRRGTMRLGVPRNLGVAIQVLAKRADQTVPEYLADKLAAELKAIRK